MRAFLFLLALIQFTSLAAQTTQIRGTVLSEKSEALTGALIALQFPWDEVHRSAITDEQGNFLLTEVEPGGYELQITYLGYVDYKFELTIKDATPINLGPLQLQEDAVNLTEVEVKEKLPMATQQGDTTAFNADAFKTLPDASAEDLIRKLPGVVIQNGQVQAQGEQVQQVLVDGQPFFGNDPNAALKNLPAAVVQKIEVFDQQSEQARFSGIEDGNTTKTINIVTRPNMRNGQFGKVYSGAGFSSMPNEEIDGGETAMKYQGGGSGNIFKNNQRISLIGQLNNVNEQNFSTDDILGVTGNSGRRRGRGRRGGGTENFLVNNQDGIAKTEAIGINYTNKWGEKTKLTASYFFNHSDRATETVTTQNFIAGENIGRSYSENNTGNFDNINHRINARLEISLDSFTSVILQPRLSWQINKGRESSNFSTLGTEEKLSEGFNSFSSNLQALNLSGNVLIRRRFKKRGRTISLRLNGQQNSNEGDEYSSSINEDVVLGILDTVFYSNSIVTPSQSWSTNLSYTEPLTEKLSLMADFEPSWSSNREDNGAFYEDAGGFNVPEIVPSLSSDLEDQVNSQSIGLGFRYRLSRDFFAMVRWRGAWSEQQIDQQLPTPYATTQSYFFHVPFAMLRWKVSERSNLRLFYRSSADIPRADQLISALDISNPLQFTTGNPDLLPSQAHRVFSRFQLTNSEKASVFYANLGFTWNKNAISNAIYLRETAEPFFEDIVLARGGQLSRPVNVDNSWTMRAFTTYGFPLTKLKTNLSLNLNFNLTNSPGLIDNVINEAKTATTTFGLTLASNFSESIDFTIGSNTGWSTVNNSLTQENNTQYLDHRTFAKVDAILTKGFVFRANLIHQYYRGFAPDFSTDYYLLTAGIGKKIFKDQRGEILLSVFDILNQNQGVTRNFLPSYVEDINTTVLQMYAMLSFTYNFRNFNLGSGPTGIEEEKRRRPWN